MLDCLTVRVFCAQYVCTVHNHSAVINFVHNVLIYTQSVLCYAMYRLCTVHAFLCWIFCTICSPHKTRKDSAEKEGKKSGKNSSSSCQIDPLSYQVLAWQYIFGQNWYWNHAELTELWVSCFDGAQLEGRGGVLSVRGCPNVQLFFFIRVKYKITTSKVGGIFVFTSKDKASQPVRIFFFKLQQKLPCPVYVWVCTCTCPLVYTLYLYYESLPYLKTLFCTCMNPCPSLTQYTLPVWVHVLL